MESPREAKPLFYNQFPLPLGRGIKGEGYLAKKSVWSLEIALSPSLRSGLRLTTLLAMTGGWCEGGG